MKRFNLQLVAAIVVGCASGFAGATAEAGWHWHGSVGGYTNAWGSYGGSYGSHGAHWGHGHHHWGHWGRLWGHHRWHGGSYGSYGGVAYGSWGSYGGSVGSYGSSGGGSSGGSYGGGKSGGGGGVMQQQPGAVPMQPPPPPGAAPGAPVPGAPLPQGNQAMLKVSVPEDALIYVNGMLTQSKGTQRSYVSRGLARGFHYSYEVRAEAMRDGQKVEEVKLVKLTAGETLELAFDKLAAQNSETTLTLNVPANAKVTLGGNSMQGEGEVRIFTTTKLGEGAVWSNYVVEVSVERDGRTLTQEKTISLNPGDNRSLTFDFDETKVAAAR
jgi:uncharacterized protein (TIGR03000 family)